MVDTDSISAQLSQAGLDSADRANPTDRANRINRVTHKPRNYGETMNDVYFQFEPWHFPLNLQGDRKDLAVLLVQLEEAEEQIESLSQLRIDLLGQIASIQQARRQAKPPVGDRLIPNAYSIV